MNTWKLYCDPKSKALRAAGDRSALNKLMEYMEKATWVVLRAFLNYDLKEYLDAFATSMQNKTVFDKKVVTSDTCMVRMEPTSKHIKILMKDLEKLVEFVRKATTLCQGDTMPPAEAQSCVEEWTALNKEFILFLQNSFASEVQQESGLIPSMCDIIDALSGVTACVKATFSSQVNTQAMAYLVKCIKHIIDKVVSEVPLEQSDVDEFTKNMDESMRMSSVLGENGNRIRSGLKILEVMIKNTYCLQCVEADGVYGEDGDELAVLALLKDVIEHDNFESHLENMTATTTTLASSELLDGIDLHKFAKEASTTLRKLKARSDDYIAEVIDSLKHGFDDIKVPDLTISDDLFNVEDLQHVDQVAALVSSTFTADATKQMLDVTVELEKIIGSVKNIAMSLNKAPNDLMDNFAAIESLWRQCLSWMWGS